MRTSPIKSYSTEEGEKKKRRNARVILPSGCVANLALDVDLLGVWDTNAKRNQLVTISLFLTFRQSFARFRIFWRPLNMRSSCSNDVLHSVQAVTGRVSVSMRAF